MTPEKKLGSLMSWKIYFNTRVKVKESEVTQLYPTLRPPWSVVYHTPPSMGFSRQGYRSGAIILHHLGQSHKRHTESLTTSIKLTPTRHLPHYQQLVCFPLTKKVEVTQFETSQFPASLAAYELLSLFLFLPPSR